MEFDSKQNGEAQKGWSLERFGPLAWKKYLPTLISILCVLFLIRAADWHEVAHIFRTGVSVLALFGFVALALTIVAIYAYRWRLLVGPKLRQRFCWVAAALCLGGNMFLPARGGDVWRVLYSRDATGVPLAQLFSKLLLEKIIDLITIIIVGFCAVATLTTARKHGDFQIMPRVLLAALLGLFLTMVALRFFGTRFVEIVRPFFARIRTSTFFDKHISAMIEDASSYATPSFLLVPGILTLLLWVCAYAPAYIMAAQFVGIHLTYQEALFVLFAGTLGLMIPAAPSGVGTYHASVVSAFMVLGRPASEGLLLAMAVHFLFFVAYAAPVLAIMGRSQFLRLLPQEKS